MNNINLHTSFLLKKKDIDVVCATPPITGKNLLEPLKSMAIEHGLPFKILEDHQVSNDAEVHLREGDLWYCLEGEASFVYGGALVEPQIKIRKDGTKDENELFAKEISGGTEVMMTSGDWLWIPAGQAHQHSCAGTARFMIIKIPLQ